MTQETRSAILAQCDEYLAMIDAMVSDETDKETEK